jgi:alpha-glucosidase (family GH31 glycosyl hydrolase)
MKSFLNNIFYQLLIRYFRWIVNHSCIELSESILLHCTKYDQHKEIPMTYIHRSWEYIMDESVLYTIKNLSFNDAMNNMRKLNIETEIIEIKNEEIL